MIPHKQYKTPLWLKLFCGLFLLILILVPVLLCLALATGFDNLNVGIFGILLEGSEFSALSKISLMTIFIFGGVVAYLIQVKAKHAFRIGLLYCVYALAVSSVFHLLNIGNTMLHEDISVLQYIALFIFGIYLFIKRELWEESNSSI